MEGYLDLGKEHEFVSSFEHPEDVYNFLCDLHTEYHLLDITDIKQIFVNYEMHLHYLQCVDFENEYLNEQE